MRKTTKNSKRLGALLSALAVGGFLAVTALCMLFDYFDVGGSAGETIIIVISAAIMFLSVLGIGLALFQRWKEIEGGEEEDARKY